MDLTVSKLFQYKPLPKYIGLEGRTKVKHKDVFVGVEMEMEGINKFYTTSAMSFTDDGSLKDNGVEFVTIPIKLRYLEIELKRVIESLKGNVSITSRCSTHVHMNVRDMTATQLSNMVMLYMIFERSLYRISGNRWDNNFCTPLYMSHSMVKTWFKTEQQPMAWSWYKYTGLNLSPIWGGESTKLGTVEFRQLHGTTNVEEIIQWCNLITALKRAAQDMDREELLAHIRTMKTTSGYWWLAREVFGSWSKLLTKQPTFAEDTEKCISNLKFLLLDSLLKQPKKTTKKKVEYKEDSILEALKAPPIISFDELDSLVETLLPPHIFDDVEVTKPKIKPIEVI